MTTNIFNRSIGGPAVPQTRLHTAGLRPPDPPQYRGAAPPGPPAIEAELFRECVRFLTETIQTPPPLCGRHFRDAVLHMIGLLSSPSLCKCKRIYHFFTILFEKVSLSCLLEAFAPPRRRGDGGWSNGMARTRSLEMKLELQRRALA